MLVDKTADGQHAFIKVEDSGIGMTEEEAAHIFEKFCQVESNTVKGTGLGLSLSKEIGISKKQLYRKAKALIGLNINDYILTVRSQKAKFLLSNEDLSISEVAFKVGFASQAYFSTVFKSKFGVSSSEFKAGKVGKN